MTNPSSVSLVHLGCARNLIDSELMLARFAEAGLMISGADSGVDAVVLNTCSFIGPAREESENAMRELVERKRAGEIRAVVVAGCMVQRYAHDLEKRWPEVDLFAEISDYSALASSLSQLLAGGTVESYIASDRPGADQEGSRLLATPESYAYLRISHGCDHTCSFCAIPAIRGAHRSKERGGVVAEARQLIEGGVKELLLVAEDSTAWGRDRGEDLTDLVRDLANAAPDADYGLRLMYAYPNNFPWGVLDLMREHPKVLPYLDIPVQHAATPMLKAMRRAGSGDVVRRTLDRVREAVPGVTLRSTLLVGFPGETEQDVAELVDFVKEYRLGRMGVFTYSPEQGTHGYDLPGRVPPSEAEARRDAVLAARDQVLLEDQSTWIGRELEVLVDEVHESRVVGHTAMDAPEVDPMSVIEGIVVPAGTRLAMEVLAVDEEYNLIGTPVGVLEEDPT
ncbi:MAG: 30S ribosomal protein S12 methylthiotransferase RimO [Planctomycetota bacterium]|nr:30S ribosomal protein S12 methylthiotransferase RimO [Planctomycetota bacterium]